MTTFRYTAGGREAAPNVLTEAEVRAMPKTVQQKATKRKRSGRKAPSAKKGSYYERTIVHPAARLIAAIAKKARTVAAR